MKNNKMEFKEFKTELLKKAKNVNACEDEYNKANKSKNFKQLIEVLKNNIDWCFIKRSVKPIHKNSVG